MTNTEFDMYSFWREWFAQPVDAKMRALRRPGLGGYYPPMSESPGYTGKPDPKEYFHYRLNHADAGMSPATEDIFWECYEKALAWLLERGLDALTGFDPEHCVLRVLHYFPTPDGCVGEAHRDFDLLTVSVPGTVPGLEVWGEREVFNPKTEGYSYPWVAKEDGIQVGEMLEIYTNPTGTPWLDPSRPKATTHRVRTPPNTERFKAVFFYLPPNDFELRPGFTAADYLRDALTRAGTINIGAKP
jgi:isopenicillin N synthase-like dioxygenase